MKKSDKLKQIHKELISNIFPFYWQKTSVNTRLFKDRQMGIEGKGISLFICAIELKKGKDDIIFTTMEV